MKSLYQTTMDNLRNRSREDLERENTKLRRMMGEMALSRENGIILTDRVYSETEVEIVRMTERARLTLISEEMGVLRQRLVNAQLILSHQLEYIFAAVTAAALAQNRSTIIQTMLKGRAAGVSSAYLNLREGYAAFVGAPIPESDGILSGMQLVCYGLIDHVQRALTDADEIDDLIEFVKTMVPDSLAELISLGQDMPHGKAPKMSALTDEVIARCESTGKKLPDVVRRLAYELERDRATLDAHGREMIAELDAFGSVAKAIKVLRDRIKRRKH